MPIVVKHGETGDISNYIRMQQQARGELGQLLGSHNAKVAARNAAKDAASNLGRSQRDETLERYLGMDRSALKKIGGNTIDTRGEASLQMKTGSQKQEEWSDEIRNRLAARQEAQRQQEIQTKIGLANLQAQRQAQLNEQQARQQEQLQFQKARDKGDIVLIPSAQKNVSDLQDRLASINNSNRLTPRQKQEQAAIIKQQLGDIQSNRDNFTQNKEQPLNIENMKKKGFLEDRGDGTFLFVRPDGKGAEIITDRKQQWNQNYDIQKRKLDIEEKKLEFEKGYKFTKDEQVQQKDIDRQEKRISLIRSEIRKVKDSLSPDARELAELNNELKMAREDLANMRRGVVSQGTHPQTTQSTPAPAPTPAQQNQTAQPSGALPPIQVLTKDKDALAVLDWIKQNPQDPRVPGILNSAKQKGWIQ